MSTITLTFKPAKKIISDLGIENIVKQTTGYVSNFPYIKLYFANESDTYFALEKLISGKVNGFVTFDQRDLDNCKKYHETEIMILLKRM